MDTPLVSVLMTAYNREAYVGTAIESVLASSYQNFELIVVDDQSKDSTVDIVRDYAKKDPRIKLFINEKNLGDYPNRNKAASHAKGKYLKYVDADDIIYKYSLQIMVEAMEAHDVALGISRNVIDDTMPYPRIFSPREAYHEEFIGGGLLYVGPSAAIIRRKEFEAVDGFSGRNYLGDREFWLKIASLYNILVFQPALVWWRQHPGQQLQEEYRDVENLDGRYQNLINTLIQQKHLFETADFLAAQKKIKQHHARRILAILLKKGKWKPGLRLMKKSQLSFIELLRGLSPYY